MKFSHLLIASLLLACLAAIPLLMQVTPSDWPNSSMHIQIGPYEFKTPRWWNEVTLTCPKSFESSQTVAQHVRITYGADVGDETNWREALKTWAVADKKRGAFPVYIGHCYKTGGKYPEAIEVYSDLFRLAGTQGDQEEWYQCYLAHNIGHLYLNMSQPNEAQAWLTRAANFCGPQGQRNQILRG